MHSIIGLVIIDLGLRLPAQGTDSLYLAYTTLVTVNAEHFNMIVGL